MNFRCSLFQTCYYEVVKAIWSPIALIFLTEIGNIVFSFSWTVSWSTAVTKNVFSTFSQLLIFSILEYLFKIYYRTTEVTSFPCLQCVIISIYRRTDKIKLWSPKCGNKWPGCLYIIRNTVCYSRFIVIWWHKIQSESALGLFIFNFFLY